MRASRFERKFEKLYRSLKNDVYEFCKLVSFEPTWQQRQLLDAYQQANEASKDPSIPLDDKRRKKRFAVRSGQGPGKCLPVSNTSFFVYDPVMGIRKTTEDLLGSKGEFSVCSMNESDESIVRAKATAFLSGEKPCVRLVVDSGQELELSEDHPVYTPSGWVDAGNLSPGDLVAMPRKLPPPENGLCISDSEVRFVAGILCDGGVSTDNKVTITHLPGPFLSLFLEDVTEMGGSYRQDKQVSKAYTYGLSGMLPFTRKWGLQGHKSTEKRVPSAFFGLTNKSLGIFFNSIFSCDGYVDKDGFEIILASRGFIDDLQTLLLRAGIHSRVSFKKSKCGGQIFDAWRLKISGRKNIEQFVAFSGKPVDRVIQTDAMMATCCASPNNTNTDIVPVQTKELDHMASELGIESKKGKKQELSKSKLRPKYRARDTSFWSRKKLKDFCRDFSYTGKYSKWAENDIYWVKVASIEKTGTQPVFDLNVPETGNFVANNLVIHNTTVSGVIGLHSLLVSPYCRLVVTGPTMKQCKDVWLGEVLARLRKADPRVAAMFKVTGTAIGCFGKLPKEWGALMVTSRNPEQAQGQHNENLNLIVEEASGVPRNIIEQYEGTMSNPNGLFLQIGNPNLRDCAFFDCFNKDKHLWKQFHWDAEKTPHSKWFGPQRNEIIADKYGRDSDVYRVRVRGEFPRADPNSIINDEKLDRIMGNESLLVPCMRIVDPAKQKVAKQIGIDFARFGGDESVISQRLGNSQILLEKFTHTEPADVVRRAFRIQESSGWSDEDTWFVGDATGMGSGVMFMFHEANKNIIEFHNHGVAQDRSEYDNKITEAWFNLSGLVSSGRAYLLNDPRLREQLTTRKYYLTRKNKLIVESKDEYEKRGHDSPDRADATVMSFYPHVMAQTQITGGRRESLSAKVTEVSM